MKENWEDEWKDFRGLNAFGKMFWFNARRALSAAFKCLGMDGRCSLLDVGCGTGKALKFLREFGFSNSVGIDVSPSGLLLCENLGLIKGKDVFLMDATKTSFADNSFDVVFAEGVLEHFQDFTPFVKEMCRVGKNHIVLIQPDHFSAFGRLLSVWGKSVKEFSYKVSDFEAVFGKFGFVLEYKRPFNFHENDVLIFSRKTPNS